MLLYGCYLQAIRRIGCVKQFYLENNLKCLAQRNIHGKNTVYTQEATYEISYILHLHSYF